MCSLVVHTGMGCTSLVEHTIDKGSQRPIRQGLRRHPTAYLETIDKQIDKLIQNDFVEPAASAWASNVVLVRKKDGSHRLCVDYRAVNEHTRTRIRSHILIHAWVL